LLMGHADVTTTTRYLRLSESHLKAAPSPLERLHLSPPPNTPGREP
jgi:hypothetical protein